MSKSSLFLVASCAAALTLAACAGRSDDMSASASSSLTAPSAASSAPATDTTTAQAEATTPAQPASYTDDQLRHFAAAVAEVQPITQGLANATPEQRTAAADQIRAILTRHNLDGATYNAIATQAQNDPAFAARITALIQTSTSPQGE